MKYFIYIFISLLLLSCGTKQSKHEIIVTSEPVALILQEITGSEVDNIIPSGASPHTFSPKPSDVLKATKADILFYVSKNMDGWAEKFDTKNKVELIRIIPENMLLHKDKFGDEHHHGEEEEVHDDFFNYEEIDPHFWTDPLVVKSLLPILVQKLAEVHPENAKIYKENAGKFSDELDEMDAEFTEKLESIKFKSIFLAHPSFLYLINRYGLTYGGSIEWNPGVENSPNYLADLIKKITDSGVRSIFTEPQLSQKSAEVLAEQTGTKVAILDPIGNKNGLNTYSKLMKYNVKSLKDALE